MTTTDADARLIFADARRMHDAALHPLPTAIPEESGIHPSWTNT